MNIYHALNQITAEIEQHLDDTIYRSLSKIVSTSTNASFALISSTKNSASPTCNSRKLNILPSKLKLSSGF